MTEEQMNKWFSVKHAWPEVTDGRSWSGTCLQQMKTIRITPSTKHPGFFDYATTDIRSGVVSETRRPCAGHAVRAFLENEGVVPEAYEWQAKEAPHA